MNVDILPEGDYALGNGLRGKMANPAPKTKDSKRAGGTPTGRPPGTVAKKTLILRELMERQGLIVDALVTIIVDVIKKGELPGRVHPFYSHLKFMDKQVNGRRKNRKAPTADQWEDIMDHAERLLVAEQVGTQERLGLIKDVIGYIFPKLKAVEHTLHPGGNGAAQFGVLLIADPQEKKAWSAMAQAQQQDAIEEMAANAKEVN